MYKGIEQDYMDLNNSLNKLDKLEKINLAVEITGGMSFIKTEDGLSYEDDKAALVTLLEAQGFSDGDLDNIIKHEGGILDNLGDKLRRLIKEEKHSLIIIYKRINTKKMDKLRELKDMLANGELEMASKFSNTAAVEDLSALPLAQGKPLNFKTYNELLETPRLYTKGLFYECSENISSMHVMAINNFRRGAALMERYNSRTTDSKAFIESLKTSNIDANKVLMAFPISLFDKELSITYVTSNHGEHTVETEILKPKSTEAIKPLTLKECEDLVDKAMDEIKDLSNSRFVELAANTNKLLKFNLAKEIQLLLGGLNPATLKAYVGIKLITSFISKTSRLKYNYGNSVKDLLGVGNYMSRITELLVTGSTNTKR